MRAADKRASQNFTYSKVEQNAIRIALENACPYPDPKKAGEAKLDAIIEVAALSMAAKEYVREFRNRQSRAIRDGDEKVLRMRIDALRKVRKELAPNQRDSAAIALVRERVKEWMSIDRALALLFLHHKISGPALQEMLAAELIARRIDFLKAELSHIRLAQESRNQLIRSAAESWEVMGGKVAKSKIGPMMRFIRDVIDPPMRAAGESITRGRRRSSMNGGNASLSEESILKIIFETKP